MKLPMSFGPRTINGQIAAIVVLALIIVIWAGPLLERSIRDGHDILDIEQLAERDYALSRILAVATPSEKEVILNTARRTGQEITLRPLQLAEDFKTFSSIEPVWDRIVEWLFPPDNSITPLGGWRTFLNDKRILATKVDDETMLVTPISGDVLVRKSFAGQGSYYVVAFITLIALFSTFAIWTIMLPLRRISQAAMRADISNDAVLFEENGTVEIATLARALNNMRSRIAIMVESRTRMLRGISHDLRTPLTRLKLRADQMPDGPVREAMLFDINHLDRLLGESLAYLRDNHSKEDFERTDIASMVQTICNEFSDMGNNVTYHGPNRLIANCKPLAMTRAVTNLCDNATKFANSVTIELQSDAQSITIDVIDDGPGIPETAREQVLEPFFKLDAARNSPNAGFGLGLSIVAEIVEAHRGKLEFIDRKPHGLIVRMVLPIQ